MEDRNDDETTNENLKVTLNNAEYVDMYITFVTDLLISIALIIVTIWLVCKDRHFALSTKLKASICMLFMMIIFYDIRSIYLVINRLTYDDFYENGKAFFIIMDDLGNIMMLAFNWFFSSHYLRVACLFKLTFSQHTLYNL